MKYLLVLLLVVNPFLLKAMIGDWSLETPYGDQMDDEFGVELHSTETIQHIRKFYFYKGYTVGVSDTKAGSLYFICRSQEALILKYNNVYEWKTELRKRKLVPLWTRWHDNDWRFISLIVLILIFCFILWFPIALFIGIVLYKARNDLPKRFFRGLFIGMASVVLYIFIHDTFPQSFI